MAKSLGRPMLATLLLLIITFVCVNGATVKKVTPTPTTPKPTTKMAIGNPKAPIAPKPDPLPVGNMKYNPRGIVFQFWQKGKKPNTMTSMNVSVTNFTKAPFVSSRQTKIMVHGFMANPKAAGYEIAAQKYHNSTTTTYNVILIDWSVESAKNFLSGYSEAREDTEWVGDWLAVLLQYLIKSRGADPKKIHCIGHSLGAHVCNYAALTLQDNGYNISRITGLDPANPVIEKLWTGMKGHAIYTDIIHTTRLLSRNANFGDADFYPNDGHDQPGCPLIDLEYCDHGRAIEFFIESITSSKFNATKCDTWADYKAGTCNKNGFAVMGDKCLTSTKGKYILETNAAPPFAKG